MHASFVFQVWLQASTNGKYCKARHQRKAKPDVARSEFGDQCPGAGRGSARLAHKVRVRVVRVGVSLPTQGKVRP
jgi:hypothetical protein